ncbi:MAG: MFS transporter TsgA [Woeseia sp.]|nr:MFS transporter TsgA [Woeseia sp.]MBT6210505.1 MFS transporter TsgA [Woeseia sp.]
MNWDTGRITLGGFLAYFVMSAVISPLGVISAPIATYYDISTATATATFTYLTTGILIGTLVAIFIFDFVRLKQVVIGGVILIVACIYAIYAIRIFSVFAVSLGLIGIGCGIELSAAAVVISKSYAEKMRASMLLLTDSFYSIAGVLSTVLAGWFVAREYHWSSAYLLATLASVVIAGLALSSKYPDTKVDAEKSTLANENWPISVHLVGVAMLVYLIGFVSIYSWVPNYAQETFGASVESSGIVVSRFFLGMIIGQLVMFFLVLKFPLRNLIIIYAILATLFTTSLWLVGTADHLQLAMLTLGLATGGLFKTVLTFGTTIVNDPSPKMVSYLIFHAGLGTAVAPFISSLIVESWDISAALQLVSVCYGLMVVLLLLSFMLQPTTSATA